MARSALARNRRRGKAPSAHASLCVTIADVGRREAPARRCAERGRRTARRAIVTPREPRRNRAAPKILKSGQVEARGKADHGPIHSFNRILIKRVDGHPQWRFRLGLPSKNVGLRAGLARFSGRPSGSQVASNTFFTLDSVGLRIGLARFSLAAVCLVQRKI